MARINEKGAFESVYSKTPLALCRKLYTRLLSDVKPMRQKDKCRGLHNFWHRYGEFKNSLYVFPETASVFLYGIRVQYKMDRQTGIPYTGQVIMLTVPASGPAARA
jgi:hypothetical protein